MNNIHLLIKHNILVSFDISKVLNPTYIKNLRSKLKKEGFDKFEIEKKIDQKILLDTQKYVGAHKIPGFEENKKEKTTKLTEEKKQVIYFLAQNCSKFCKTNKLSKDELILFTQLFLHMSRITNEDVQNFKNKNNIGSNSDDNYEDEEGDSDEDEL